VALIAVAPLGAGLAGVARLRIDGGDHPILGDLAGDPPGPRPITRFDILAGHQRQQRDRLGLLIVQVDLADRLEHRQRVIHQPRHQRLPGLGVVPGAVGLAWPVIVVRPHLDLTCPWHQPAHPADRRDQLADRVLGGDRVLQEGGVQHPPAPPLEHPGRLDHLADGVKDPPRPLRGPQARPPVHQHRGVEALVIQAQPAGDLPGDVAPQRADGLPVAETLQGLQHHHRGDHLGGYRGVAAALSGDVREQLGRKQLLAVVGQEGVHRPLGDQVIAPGGRVHLLVGDMAC